MTNVKIITTIQVEGLTLQVLHARLMANQQLQKRKQQAPDLAIALSDDAWVYVSGTPALFNAITPARRMSELTDGRLGTLLGVPLITDAYASKQTFPKGVSICHYKPEEL